MAAAAESDSAVNMPPALLVAELDFSLEPPDRWELAAVIRQLGTGCALNSVKFSHQSVDFELARSLAEALKVNQCLRSLDCSGSFTTANILECRRDVNSHGHPMESEHHYRLRECSNVVYDKQIIEIARGLRLNGSLTVLDLSHNTICFSGAVALAEALRNNRTLKCLKLASSIGVRDCKSPVTQQDRSSSDILDPSLSQPDNSQDGDSSAADAEVRVLAAALRSNSTITVLDLSDNFIGARGTAGPKALADLLTANASLTSLSLSRNCIGGDGFRLLAEALKHNVALSRLEVDGMFTNEDSEVSSAACELAREDLAHVMGLHACVREISRGVRFPSNEVVEFLKMAFEAGFIGGLRVVADLKGYVAQDLVGFMHLVVKTGSLGLVRWAVHHGVDLRSVDGNADTPLHVAINEGHISIALFLVDCLDTAGLNHAHDITRETALHRAARAGNLPIVIKLVERDVDIDAGDINGDTALHFAVRSKAYDLVKYLSKKGASIAVRNKQGFTPVDLADSSLAFVLRPTTIDHFSIWEQKESQFGNSETESKDSSRSTAVVPSSNQSATSRSLSAEKRDAEVQSSLEIAPSESIASDRPSELVADKVPSRILRFEAKEKALKRSSVFGALAAKWQSLSFTQMSSEIASAAEKARSDGTFKGEGTSKKTVLSADSGKIYPQSAVPASIFHGVVENQANDEMRLCKAESSRVDPASCTGLKKTLQNSCLPIGEASSEASTEEPESPSRTPRDLRRVDSERNMAPPHDSPVTRTCSRCSKCGEVDSGRPVKDSDGMLSNPRRVVAGTESLNRPDAANRRLADSPQSTPSYSDESSLLESEEVEYPGPPSESKVNDWISASEARTQTDRGGLLSSPRMSLDSERSSDSQPSPPNAQNRPVSRVFRYDQELRRTSASPVVRQVERMDSPRTCNSSGRALIVDVERLRCEAIGESRKNISNGLRSSRPSSRVEYGDIQSPSSYSPYISGSYRPPSSLDYQYNSNGSSSGRSTPRQKKVIFSIDGQLLETGGDPAAHIDDMHPLLGYSSRIPSPPPESYYGGGSYGGAYSEDSPRLQRSSSRNAGSAQAGGRCFRAGPCENAPIVYVGAGQQKSSVDSPPSPSKAVPTKFRVVRARDYPFVQRHCS